MSLTQEQMQTLFRNLVRAYHFDQMMSRRMINGRLVGFYHPGDGAIAPGVGACSFLEQSDYLNPHHRAHGQPHMLSKGIDLKHYLAEHTAKAAGCCQGRSSFHFCFPEHGVFLMSGFIGFNFPPVVGLGWAAQRRGNGQVVMNCSGDGSYGQGKAHECMLMAQNWKLPIVFVCENNGLAIFAEADEMHPTDDIADMAKAYAMPAAIVDGQDVFAVAEAVLPAIARARAGEGPTLIEAKTLRFREHDIGTPNLRGHTERSKEEIEALMAREPVKLATERVLADKILTQGEIDAVHAEAQAEVEAAEEYSDSLPLPDVTVEDLRAAVYAD
jgi:pyruvate dehydrogenase E1 component alpha subunit